MPPPGGAFQIEMHSLGAFQVEMHSVSAFYEIVFKYTNVLYNLYHIKPYQISFNWTAGPGAEGKDGALFARCFETFDQHLVSTECQFY